MTTTDTRKLIELPELLMQSISILSDSYWQMTFSQGRNTQFIFNLFLIFLPHHAVVNHNVSVRGVLQPISAFKNTSE